jgi:hypothetical protein
VLERWVRPKTTGSLYVTAKNPSEDDSFWSDPNVVVAGTDYDADIGSEYNSRSK